MPKRKTTVVAPLPRGWLHAVIPLLEAGDAGKIQWTGRALREMSAVGIGFKHEAYDLCLEILRSPSVLGEQILDMVDDTDNTLCETWAFPCRNPLGQSELLYVKIGLHQGKLHINFFSLHVDLSGKLRTAIQNHLKHTQ